MLPRSGFFILLLLAGAVVTVVWMLASVTQRNEPAPLDDSSLASVPEQDLHQVEMAEDRASIKDSSSRAAVQDDLGEPARATVEDDDGRVDLSADRLTVRRQILQLELEAFREQPTLLLAQQILNWSVGTILELRGDAYVRPNGDTLPVPDWAFKPGLDEMSLSFSEPGASRPHVFCIVSFHEFPELRELRQATFPGETLEDYAKQGEMQKNFLQTRKGAVEQYAQRALDLLDAQ